MKPLSWSYSALTAFESCPRKFEQTRLLKNFSDGNYANTDGAKKHKELELYLQDGQPVTSQIIVDNMAVVEAIRALPGQHYVEYQMALDSNYQPCGYKDWNNAWLRAVLDVLVVDGDTGIMVDWKFGKVKQGDEQLRLAASVVFAHFSNLKKVKPIYVYFDGKSVPKYEDIRREELQAIRSGFGVRYSAMQAAKQNNNFPPKPSGLCRKHCPVHTCEFHGGS